nr:integrase, catalytic region, zinc finger, CCHC-type, peptidase aspartic, catalytic [Tanacetum cinerariifolium]
MSASESAYAEEPVQTTCQMEETLHSVFETGADDQPIVQTSQHPEWFSQPRRPPSPDRAWNTALSAAQGDAQSWISDLARQTDARSSFNELLDTPIEFSDFIMHRLNVDTLTPDLLAGPTYELMRRSCTSLTELEYHLEEVYKATTDQLDWVNPEGQQYPHNLLQPLPLIPDNRGRRVIPFEYFINNELEYLRGGASSRKYTTFVTKTKAADYGHIKWIEDLVPREMWIQKCGKLSKGYNKPEWSRFVTIIKQQHKLDEVSYHKLFDILKQYQKEVNELHPERLAKNDNPLALVATAQANQDPYYQISKYKGKEIAKPITSPSESASKKDRDPEQAQRDKDMQKNLALIEKKPKRVKDFAYHKEKMLLCKQAKKGVPLQAEQCDWLADTDEEIDEQEFEAHYSYMAKIQEVPIADTGTNSEPLEQDMEILIQTCLMPLSLKTQNDSFIFVHELKQEMHADLKYGESLEKEIDELKSDKAKFSNMYDMILQEYLKAQLQDKNITISELKKLIEKGKGKSVKTKFDKPSVVRQPNAQRIPKPSVLGKPAPFLDSLERRYFSKTKSVPKTNVSEGLSKPVTTQTLPQTARQAIVQLILFIVDSGCTKHMTGNLKLLCNFVEKFLGTVCFGNDQFAPILGYGDLVQGNITINKVYYVEGLNHNLFSVGQFYDADLEVAFRKSTCFVRDLQGNDLLTSNRGSDLYTISLQESTSSTPLCLMAKASPTQAWLWHRRVSHLNFDYINLLSKKDIVIGLPKLKFVKDQLCSYYKLSKAKKKLIQVKSCSKFQRKAKFASYGLIDGEHLDKMKEKGDLCILVGYSNQSKGYHVYNKRTSLIVESIHIRFDEIKEMSETSVANDTSGLVPQRQKASDYDDSDPVPHLQNVSSSADAHVPSHQELDLLFGPLYDEFFAADHPLKQVRGNPSKLVQTRRQLVTDPEMCMFALTVSTAEPKNIKEAMADSAWIEAMQEELVILTSRISKHPNTTKPITKHEIRIQEMKNNMSRMRETRYKETRRILD